MRQVTRYGAVAVLAAGTLAAAVAQQPGPREELGRPRQGRLPAEPQGGQGQQAAPAVVVEVRPNYDDAGGARQATAVRTTEVIRIPSGQPAGTTMDATVDEDGAAKITRRQVRRVSDGGQQFGDGPGAERPGGERPGAEQDRPEAQAGGPDKAGLSQAGFNEVELEPTRKGRLTVNVTVSGGTLERPLKAIYVFDVQ